MQLCILKSQETTETLALGNSDSSTFHMLKGVSRWWFCFPLPFCESVPAICRTSLHVLHVSWLQESIFPTQPWCHASMREVTECAAYGLNDDQIAELRHKLLCTTVICAPPPPLRPNSLESRIARLMPDMASYWGEIVVLKSTLARPQRGKSA